MRRRLVGAVLLGGFVGTVALAATLSTTAAVAELFGAEHPLNVTYALLGWLRKRLSVSDVGATTLARVALNKALVQNRNLQKEPSCFDTRGGGTWIEMM